MSTIRPHATGDGIRSSSSWTTTRGCVTRCPASWRRRDVRSPCSPRRPTFLQADKPDVPACLVLDLELPDIHGLELQKKLVEREAPPIVFITGHGDVSSSVKAMKAGAVEFLSKPFGDDELLRAIDAAIELDRAARLKRSERLELARPLRSDSHLVNVRCSPSSSLASPTS